MPPSLIPTIVLNLGLRTEIARRNSIFVASDEVRSVSEGRGYGRDACGRDDTASGGDCERDARHPMDRLNPGARRSRHTLSKQRGDGGLLLGQARRRRPNRPLMESFQNRSRRLSKAQLAIKLRWRRPNRPGVQTLHSRSRRLRKAKPAIKLRRHLRATALEH